ncbi:MAG: flavodoxin [Segetibacter sp.]|jgi:multimeric flavodoxin WrbA|nr:flavodoxin [Segetibacter sp.]
MKAIILLATLKKQGLSNTEVLSQFLAEQLKKKGVESEIMKLVNYNILPGTYDDMGGGDEWPAILSKIVASDMIIFATPIWWSNMSSEMQRAIERLDNIHDEILEGKPSRLENKVGGIVITGDSDGAQHIIADVANFFNAIGIVLPPYATLSVMYEGQAKGAKTTREELWKKYDEEYTSTAEKMVSQMLKYVQVSK